jgi:hypothetical protein
MFFKYLCILGIFYRIATCEFCNAMNFYGDQIENWLDRHGIELNKMYWPHLWDFFGIFCTPRRASTAIFFINIISFNFCYKKNNKLTNDMGYTW